MANTDDTDRPAGTARAPLNRRMLLQAATAAVAPMMAATTRAEAGPEDELPNPSAGRIDVQFHFSPPFYTEMIKHTKHIATDRWNVEAAFAYMERYHVAAGVMSVSSPSVHFLPAPQSVALARRLNEAAAEVARSHPGRFGNFATLPMLDVHATLKEIAYCLDTLKMDGVCMMSNVAGLYLGHSSFAPIFDELNRRRAVIFIHPNDPSDYGQLKMAPVVEWPFDTCRAAIDLIYSGTIRRCPDLRIILAHAGGALPAVAQRAEEMSILYSGVKPPIMLPEAMQQVGHFYYDLAISAHENTIGALRALCGLDHVLFACDWPYAPDRAVALNVAGFDALKLTAAERHAIERGTAATLFPQLVGR